MLQGNALWKGSVGAAFFILLGLGGPEAGAETFYRFVDAKGVIHFSNAPTDARYQKMPPNHGHGPWQARPPSRRLLQTIAQASQEHRVDPALIRAVIQAESAFNPSAVSPKGAIGLMQLMPETALLLNVTDPFDPQENIAGGARYLRYLLDRFQGDVTLALAAYNAGEGRVERESGIPAISETREYVRRVLHFYQAFSRPQ